MKIYAKGTKEWDQAVSVNLSVNDIIKKYESGFAGTFLDPEQRELFTELSKKTGGYTDIEDAAKAFNWFGSFEGQLVVPYVHVMEALPGVWPGAAQGRGDCFAKDTLVRMANGSLKKIQDICIGEYVLSHTNTPRMVTNVFKKPYSGKMLEIKVEKLPYTIKVTPDHQIQYHINPFSTGHKERDKTLLKRADEFIIGDNVSIGYGLQDGKDGIILDLSMCDGLYIDQNDTNLVSTLNNSKKIYRYVEVDEDLSWLIGIYLAEGGVDRSRDSKVVFSLCKDELGFAKEIDRIILNKFGISGKIFTPNHRDDIILVEYSSTSLSKFFLHIINGNIYSKSVPQFIIESSYKNKIKCIRGWIDGDGYLNIKKRPNSKSFYCRITGVSVSENLILDMYNISLSCGLLPSVFRRKIESHQNVAAKEINYYSQDVIKIYPELEQKIRLNIKVSNRKNITKYGVFSKVSSINEFELIDDYVYCIEVEHDHMFQANFINVKNCVSHSNKNTILGTMVCEVVSGQPDEASGMLETIPKISLEGIRNGGLSTEVSYWFRESDRDGWFCEASANVSMQYAGAVIRGPLEGTNIDLTKYTAELAGKYGARKPPQEVINAINKNLIRTAARANTFDGIRDALGQGKFIHTCGMEGFAKSRNEHGLSRRSGSWAHAMGYIAVDDRPEIRAIYKEPLVLILNSWGKRWISGPRDILNSSKFVPENKKLKWIKCGIVNPNTGNLLIPEGSFWARWSEISGRNMTVFSGLNGWKMSKINNWGTDILG